MSLFHIVLFILLEVCYTRHWWCCHLLSLPYRTWVWWDGTALTYYYFINQKVFSCIDSKIKYLSTGCQRKAVRHRGQFPPSFLHFSRQPTWNICLQLILGTKSSKFSQTETFLYFWITNWAFFILMISLQ